MKTSFLQAARPIYITTNVNLIRVPVSQLISVLNAFCQPPDKSQLFKINYLFSKPKTYVVGTQNNHLTDVVLLDTQTGVSQ